MRLRLTRALRWLLRRALLPALFNLGLFGLVRVLRRRFDRRARLLILLYHRVHDPDRLDFRYTSDTLAVSPDHFTAQVDYLARHYRVMPLEQALGWLDDAGGNHGEVVAITFDDGYRDNLTLALPILARHRLTATIFLATDFIGSGRLTWFDQLAVDLERADLAAFRQGLDDPAVAPIGAAIGAYAAAPRAARRTLVNSVCETFKVIPNERKDRILADLRQLANRSPDPEADRDRELMLDWPGVRALAQAGFGIGSHSRSHPILSRVPTATVEHELAGSKQAIEAELGVPCTLFAYPNGGPDDIPDQASAQLQSTGYTAAFTTVPGTVRTPMARAGLHRVSIGNYPLAIFASVIEFWLWR